MKNKYVFIITISFLCSMLLSLVAEGLKEKKELNIELDKKKNILESIGIKASELSSELVKSEFNANIKELVLDLDGNVVTGLNHEDLDRVINRQTGETKYFNSSNEYLPLFLSENMNSIIMPISGKGLWSSLFGYFALDVENYSTVKGITFYEHGETPGLGAEITKDWFMSSFIGKEIFSDNKLISINVAKAGKANKKNIYEVDGISGATITGKGVEFLLKRDLLRYEPYLRNNK